MVNVPVPDFVIVWPAALFSAPVSTSGPLLCWTIERLSASTTGALIVWAPLP